MVIIFIQLFLPPLYLLGIPDKHVFYTDGIAINTFEMFNNFRQSTWLKSQNTTCIKDSIKICLIQAEIFNIKCRAVCSQVSNWVRLGKQMTSCSVPIDQFYDLKFLVYLLRYFHINLIGF